MALSLNPALLLALTLTALVAGCTAPDPGLDADAENAEAGANDQSSSAAGSMDSGSHGTSSVTSSQDLGSASGMSLQPARFDFTVTVPDGGAKNVRWTMTIETLGNSVLNSVEGPGCTTEALSSSFSILGSATFGGECDDLAAGEHAFTAVLGSPTLGFEAKVQGQVTVVNEW